MRSLVLALLLVPSLAWAKEKPKPLPGDQHDPPAFNDEASTTIRLLGANDDGYKIEANIYVAGPTSKGDLLRIEWKQNGKPLAIAKCSIQVNTKLKQAGGECITEGEKGITAKGEITGDLIFWDDKLEKEFLLRTFKVTVGRWKGEVSGVQWQVMPDDLLGTAWVFYWWGEQENDAYRRPEIWFWTTALTHKVDGTLRCSVEGKKLDDDIGATLNDFSGVSEIEASLIPAKGDAVRYRWEHVRLTPDVRFGTRENAGRVGKIPEKLFLIDHQGKWDCQLRTEGRAVRQFMFTVGDDGMIKNDEMQSGKNPVPILHDFYSLIDVRIPEDAEFDARLRPDAMKKSMGWGLPWPDHPKVKTIHEAFPKKSGPPDPK